MRTQSRDTHPEAERVLIELIRKASVAKRFELVRSMTTTLTKMNVQNYWQQHSEASWTEIVQAIIPRSHQLNTHLLDTYLQKRSNSIAFEPDILQALISITTILEKLNITYYIGGSLASAVYGMQQLAQDIDLVIKLQPFQVPQLVTLLEPAYYVDVQEMYKAVMQNEMFTVIDLHTLLVIDIFMPCQSVFEEQINERVKKQIVDEKVGPLPLSSPEDIILVKLFHHRKDKKIPDDQWNDILGVLKVQGFALDIGYLDKWAAHLTVKDILWQAYTDSGMKE